MKKRSLVLIVIIACFSTFYLSGFILDIIGKLGQSIKKSVVISAIRSKISSFQPRFVAFETKGRLVRDAAIISFLLALSTFFIAARLLYRKSKDYRQKKTTKQDFLLALLLLVLSLCMIGIVFGMFWIGEYMMHLPVSIEAIVEKHA